MNTTFIALASGGLAVATAFIRFATLAGRGRKRADAVAAERAARSATPAVETRPGHNRDDLTICNAIPNGPKGDQP